MTTEAGARGRKCTNHQPATDTCPADQPPETAHSGPSAQARWQGLTLPHLSVQNKSTRQSCFRYLVLAKGCRPGEVGLSFIKPLRKQGPPGECLKLVTGIWGARDSVRYGDPNLATDYPASRMLRLFRVPDKIVSSSRFLQIILVFRI